MGARPATCVELFPVVLFNHDCLALAGMNETEAKPAGRRIIKGVDHSGFGGAGVKILPGHEPGVSEKLKRIAFQFVTLAFEPGRLAFFKEPMNERGHNDKDERWDGDGEKNGNHIHGAGAHFARKLHRRLSARDGIMRQCSSYNGGHDCRALSVHRLEPDEFVVLIEFDSKLSVDAIT
jgi:hypothetical protein